MKSLSSALQAHLDDGTTTLSWCWWITRVDGVTLGFTDHDAVLTFDGTGFEPGSGFAASEIRSGSDLSVDAQDAEGVLTSDRITETDIIDGRWDAAQVELWRVNWADTSQRVLMRLGAVGQIRRGRMAFVAEVRSLAHVLNQTVGRAYQASCDAALGDGRCGVDLEAPAFKGSGIVLSLIRDRGFFVSGLGAFAPGWFASGTMEWTSGGSAGRRAEVMMHEVADTGVTITLLEASVRVLGVGDAFVIRAGCDKRLETCRDRFANAVNFRGFPNIPGQDAVLRYASNGDANQGVVL
ncbi:MAG: beta tubulin [Rhodobacterales bacterium 17-64-5]|nr:MAG: beta tubulin [Rhodobacterales bacterium 17-64-5]